MPVSPRGVPIPKNVPAGWTLIRDCPSPPGRCKCLQILSGLLFLHYGIPVVVITSFEPRSLGELAYVPADRVTEIAALAKENRFPLHQFNCLLPEE